MLYALECIYIEKIQIFVLNMLFISSSEAKNAYFMSGEATNEIFIFSLHEMKYMAYSFQKFEFTIISFTECVHTRSHIAWY